jgi:hypothetical protein
MLACHDFSATPFAASGKKRTGIAEKEVTLGREMSLIFQRLGRAHRRGM